MSLPNPSMDFSAFDVLPATSLDNMVANIEALAAGTGLNANAVISSKYLSNPHKFSVYRSAASSLPSGGTLSPIVFDTKVFDTGTNYDTSTGRFTAPIAGYYQFNAYNYSTVAASDSTYMQLLKNGVMAYAGTTANNFSTNSNAVNTVAVNTPPMLLAAGNYITVVLGHAGAYAMAINVGPTNTYFGGFLISAT